MALPTSPSWNETEAQDLAYMHVGHKIKLAADADHSISGTLEELHITRERYITGGELKRKPAMVDVVIGLGDVLTRFELRGHDKVWIKP